LSFKRPSKERYNRIDDVVMAIRYVDKSPLVEGGTGMRDAKSNQISYSHATVSWDRQEDVLIVDLGSSNSVPKGSGARVIVWTKPSLGDWQLDVV